MRNPKAPLPPRLSQPDGYEVQSRPPPSGSGASGVREQIEPEGFFEDAQDETRPALQDEAKKAIEMANARRKSLAPIIDKDAETAAMMPNDYQKALDRLKAQRASQAPPPISQPPPPSVPPADKTTRDRPREERSDPAFALAQLTAQRASQPPMQRPMTGPAFTPTGPSMARPTPNPNGTGPNRPLSMESASAIPSARDLAANLAARRSLVDAKPASSPSVNPPAPPPPTDDPEVIKSLLGGAMPPSPRVPSVDPLSKSGGTAPMKLSELGLKPPTGAMPLAPQRSPAPMAVVGKGGLPGSGGVMVTDRPGSMPPSGFGGFPKTQPSAQAPARPQMPSRPPGAFGPAPGQSAPPKQYDFKRWSSPDISEMPNDGSPVTFQVYTAQDVAQGRKPMRSLPMIEPQKKSAGSIAMKVGLAVLGGVIVLITAAAVILVSTDEPKKPDIKPVPPPSASSVSLAPEPVPTSTVIVIPGDNTPEEPPSATTSKKPPKPLPALKPVAAPPPANNPSVTPPPNPYGKP